MQTEEAHSTAALLGERRVALVLELEDPTGKHAEARRLAALLVEGAGEPLDLDQVGDPAGAKGERGLDRQGAPGAVQVGVELVPVGKLK